MHIAGMEKFTICWLVPDRLLLASLFGFWSADDMVAYRRAMIEAVGRRGEGPVDLIGDLSGLMPQSKEVVLAQDELVTQLVAAGVARLVIVGAPVLVVMQVKRAAAPLSPTFAESVEAARASLSGAAPKR